jgi:hypothetical protein
MAIRLPKTIVPEEFPEEKSAEWKAKFDKFTNSADGGDNPEISIALNPDAKRDYKAIQYEFERVEDARLVARRTRVSFIRTAMLKFADELLKDTK